MCENLSWENEAPCHYFSEVSTSERSLLATYLLCCQYHFLAVSISKPVLRMIQILLQTGGDPAAVMRIGPSPRLSQECGGDNPLCFWNRWLFMFVEQSLRISSEDRNGLWQICKLCLAAGADINHGVSKDVIFSRWSEPNSSELYLSGRTSAMFILHGCFSSYYPEIDTYAATAARSIKHPWRKISSIRWNEYRGSRYRDYEMASLSVTEQEEDRLFDLIETWEGTGRPGDEKLINAAVEEIWNDRHGDTVWHEAIGDSNSDSE